MNDLLDAANNKKDESSEDRYEKLKKEEAGTKEEDLAEKRYQKLKEEAKREFIEKQEREEQQEAEDEEDEEEGFITY